MIYDIVKEYRNFKRHDGEIGIEIETECLDHYDVPNLKFWKGIGDNSLRNFGIEYVLNSPLKYGDDLDKAFREFEEKTEHIKFINNPIGGSVHVHLNFLNESFQTLGNFLTTTALTENLLMEYSGPDRRGNLFCLPICDAEETLLNITGLFKSVEDKSFNKVFQNKQSVKYANINIGAFGEYGSIEIRSFRGETKIPEIKTWVDILYSILQYSRKDRNPRAIIDDLKVKGNGLLVDIFGHHAQRLKCKNWESKFDKNIWYAANIAHSVKNWDVLDIPKMGEFQPTVQEIELCAMKLYGEKNTQNLNLDQFQMIIDSLRREFEAKEFKKVKVVKQRVNPFDNPLRDGLDFLAQQAVPAQNALDQKIARIAERMERDRLAAANAPRQAWGNVGEGVQQEPRR